jgi:hypothetical protein
MNTNSLSLVSSSSQRAYAAYSTALQPSSITIEAWIKPSGLSARQDIVLKVKNEATNNASYLLTLGAGGSNNVLYAIFQNGSNGVQIGSNSTLTAGVWTHIAVTYDGTTANIYINGNATADSTATLNQALAYSGSHIMNIGCTLNNSDTPSGGFFNGLIDDIRIWNTVRTGIQINSDFRRELGGNESGLVGYWKLDNNYNDATSNANTLTSVNSPTFSTDLPFVDSNGLFMGAGL